jgi:hypothetical protein
MQSKITGGDTTLLFTAKILGKYDVKYYRCNETGFIQTEEPHWLDEAYSSAITQLDIGLPYRNYTLATRVGKILAENFDTKKTYLDYAGGYGLFTRLMRDKGFNFYHTDKYCQNLFANYFDLQDLKDNPKFELTTTFEVFEHLANPMEEIKQILQFSDSLLFSTELQPKNISKVDDWSYFSTETGQHVSFYTSEALEYIADKLGYNFYSDGSFLHLFTKHKFGYNLLAPAKEGFLLRKAKKYIRKKENTAGMPQSLLMRDWQYIKDKLNGKSS